ncbi:MAG: hypothetical protein ACQEXJ_06125 [Myxococcota bacterium]
MDRVVHKARSSDEAQAWDVAQYRGLTLHERQEIARVLRVRVYGADSPDVRTGRIARRTRLGEIR